MNEDLATRLRTAFNDRDVDALRPLLAADATWGEDPHGELTCHDRNDIIRRLKQLLDAGVRATIVEATTGPRGIAARLEVEWPKRPDGEPNRRDYCQAYVVADGLVTAIRGYDDFDSARAAISD